MFVLLVVLVAVPPLNALVVSVGSPFSQLPVCSATRLVLLAQLLIPVSAFLASLAKIYTQEFVLPVLTVTAPTARIITSSALNVKWDTLLM